MWDNFLDSTEAAKRLYFKPSRSEKQKKKKPVKFEITSAHWAGS